MKLLAFLLFFSFSSFAKFTYTLKNRDLHCNVTNRTSEFLSIEKRNKNIIKVAARVTNKCEFKASPILIYWILGEYPQGEIIPCDGLNMFEKMFLKVKKKHVRFKDRKTVYWKSKVVYKQLNKFPQVPSINREMKISLSEEAGECKAQAYMVMDGIETPIDRIYLEREGLSVHQLEVFDEGDSILFLKK